MAKVVFTPQQQLVIDKRKSNILVSAAAGSGKTEVLSKRIVSLITDETNPVDIDRMLILTFTKAAAAEMRERIGREINNRLAEKPEDENLWRQSTLLLGAQISTIDSFCLFVVKNNFSDIDLDPGFRIMDEGEKKLLLKDTIHSIFEKHYDDKEDYAFRHLIECYSSKGNDNNFEDLIIKMHQFVMSHPEPEKWIEQALDEYRLEAGSDITENKLWKANEKIIKLYIKRGCALITEALNICNEPEGPDKYLPSIQALFDVFDSLMNAKSFDRCYRVIHMTEIPGLPKGKIKDGDPELRAYVKKLRDKAGKYLEKLSDIFVSGDERILQDSQYVLESATTIMQLLKELIQEFSDIKREKNIIDFSDMEHMALKILLEKDENGNFVPTKSAQEYREYFEVVMVDEYQDSNLVQEYILKSITRDDNYFMVGDVKQSIYRFRQARPEIFIEKYLSYDNAEKVTDSINSRIDLNKNFRSRVEVIDFVNDVFESIMHKDTASIDYDESARLVHGANYYPEGTGFNSEVILLDTSSKEAVPGIDGGSHIAEAVLIANKINEMISQGFQVTDKETGRLRNIKYKDIVILLRSTDKNAGIYKNIFEEQGIPAYTNIKNGYFAATEVKTLLNYLSIIDNPRQDIPFFGVLTSYFGGFTPAEVAKIKADYNQTKDELQVEETLYDIFLKCETEEFAERKSKLLGYLNEYRKCAAYISIRDLIEKIIFDTGYLDYMTAFSNGAKRKANIYAILEKALAFEQTSFHGLFHFVRYISMLKLSEVDFGEAGMLDENDDVVRIMTIHASKGLEFPVCFVAGCGSNFNKKDGSGDVIYEMTYGLGLNYINPTTREKRDTVQKQLLKRKIDLLGMAEEIRVLYVALTRAKEKLIITAEISKTAEYISKFPEPGMLMDNDVIDAGSYIDLIMLALANAGKINDYVSVLEKKDLVVQHISKEIEKKQLHDKLKEHDFNTDEKIITELLERMNPAYAHSELKGLYSKTTVSELKKAAYEMEDEDAHHMFMAAAKDEYIPVFIKEKEEKVSGGSLRGTAYHRIMELTDFAKMAEYSDKQAFAAETIKNNTENGKIASDLAVMVNPGECKKFYDSKLALRMSKADDAGKLYKEKSFFYGMSADRIKPEFPKEELILVQGVIDVYFQEEDYLVVADYKTDNVRTEEELVKRYKTQLDIYAEALSSITGIPVREKIIYSFVLNKEILL